MKYQLSFCEIEQLSENVFETIAKEGIVLDKNCADEAWNFWNELRDKAFVLLVNCKNKYRHSFRGSREIGRHPLQQKTAILLNNAELEIEMKTVIEIKKLMEENYTQNQFFTDREEAIKWLSDI